MAALDTFRGAAGRALSENIQATTMAGTHLSIAHRYRDSFFAELHRGLADDHARAANMWLRTYQAYDAAEEAVRARMEAAEHEARELALAARFHDVLDRVPVAA